MIILSIYLITGALLSLACFMVREDGDNKEILVKICFFWVVTICWLPALIIMRISEKNK